MASLICRWCKNSNVKALGENTQCFDCGRLAESLTYAPEAEPEPEPEPEADQTPEEAEEAAALAVEIEAEEAARAAAADVVAAAPLPVNSPLARAKKKP